MKKLVFGVLFLQVLFSFPQFVQKSFAKKILVKLDMTLLFKKCKWCTWRSMRSIVVENKDKNNAGTKRYYNKEFGNNGRGSDQYTNEGWRIIKGATVPNELQKMKYPSIYLIIEEGDLIYVSGSGVQGGDVYSLDVPVKLGHMNEKYDDSSKDGVTWWNSTIFVKTFGYSLTPDIRPSTTTQVCISNFKEKTSFNLESTNTIQQSGLSMIHYDLRLEVANNRSFYNSNIFDFDDNVTNASFTYEQIAGSHADDWLGNELYFRTVNNYKVTSNDTLGFGASIIKSAKSNSSLFPGFMAKGELVSDIEVKRSSCFNDMVIMTLNQTTFANLEDFTFKASLTGSEATSIIIPLSFKELVNDKLYLNTNSIKFASEGKKYTFNIEIPNGCNVELKKDVPARPEPLSFSASAVTKVEYDGITYHVSKYRGSDGEITLKVLKESGSRMDRFVYQNGDIWEDIPPKQLTTEDETTYKFKGLRAKTYYINVYDTDGCLGTQKTVPALKQPEVFKFETISTSVVTCHEENGAPESKKKDGIIEVTFRGGIGRYKVSWYKNLGPTSFFHKKDEELTASNKSDNDNYTTQLTGIPVGSYTVIIYDTLFNTLREKVELTSNPKMVLSATPTNLECFGDGSGAVKLSVTNKRTKDATYKLRDQTQQRSKASPTSFSRLSAGTYTATVTNTDGCSAVLNNIKVEQPVDINVTATPSNIVEYGESTGKIELSNQTEGVLGDYFYKLYKDDTYVKGKYRQNPNRSRSLSFSDLESGNYKVVVIDITNITAPKKCRKTLTDIQVKQPSETLKLELRSKQNVDCFGNATGKVVLEASGGWGGYKYGINGEIKGTSNVIDGLRASKETTNIFFVKDSEGAIRQLTVDITQPDPLTTSIYDIGHLKCFEDNSGAVKLNINGGTPDYRVSLDNKNWIEGNSLSNLSAGVNQTIYVRDANDCPSEIKVSILEPEKLNAKVKEVKNLLCFEDGTGKVKLDIEGGTTPHWVSKDNQTWIESNIIEELQAGKNQKFWVRDANSCSTSLEASISQPELLIATPTVGHLSCFEDNSGNIHMNVKEGTGTPPYFISVDNENWLEGTSISNLPANPNQDVFIRDANNCEINKRVAINQPDKLKVTNYRVDDLKCFGDGKGKAQLDIEGGITPYSISVDNANWIVGNYMHNLDAISSLKIYVKDRNECKTHQTVSIGQPDELIAEIDRINNLNCFEDNSGAVKLDIKGGTIPYEISKNNRTWVSGNSLSNLSATNATDFFVRDNNNCETSINVTITQPKILDISVVSVLSTHCGQKDGEIKIKVAGGTISTNYKYSWQNIDSEQKFNAEFQLRNICSGQYNITVTDDNNCQASKKIPVSDLDGPVLNKWHSDSVTCFGGSDGAISVDDVTGGEENYAFYLNDQKFVDEIVGLKAAIYHLKILDAKNCEINKSIEIFQPDSLGYTMTKTIPTCNGMSDGAFSIDLIGGNGGYTYSWLDGEASLSRSDLKSDLYKLSVSDKHGCDADFNIYLDEPEPLVVESTLVSPICSYSSDGRIMITPSGGNGNYIFDWNTGNTTSTISQLEAGDYSLLLTDSKNCVVDTSFTLSSPNTMVINPEITNILCFDDANGAITANVIGGTGSYNYSWGTGSVSASINGLRKGTYSLDVMDDNNCQISDKFSLDHPEKLSVVSNLFEPTCNGYNNGSLSVKALGGNGDYSYQWNTSQTTSDISILTAGDYFLTVADIKNCQVNKKFTINEPAPITIEADILPPTCHASEDAVLQLYAYGGSGSFSYMWNENKTAKSVLSGLGAGIYTIVATDSNNCTGTNEFFVDAPLPITPPLNQIENVLCTGNSLELDGGDFMNYKWFKDDVLVSQDRYLTVNQTGQYTLKIINEFGCVGVDTVLLEVSDTPLDATFLLQDTALVDEVIEAIDVTWPMPDSIQWYFDYPVKLAENNNWSQQFSANSVTTINVTLRAWYGGCSSNSSKSVTIYPNEGITQQKQTSDEPLILGYKAFPNPNDGNFFVEVELSRTADISLHLFSLDLGTVINLNQQKGLKSYKVTYNLIDLQSGVYVIVLVTEREQQNLRIVIE